MRSANALLDAASAPVSDAGGDISLTLPAAAAGLRFDVALAKELPQYSRSRLKAWIEEGRVRVDARVADPSRKVAGGEHVTVHPLHYAAETSLVAQDIALDIVHEDDAILVIDKPPGLVVHPGSGNRDRTMQNALLHHAPQLAHVPRAGIVHRLDKDTSGLLVVARTLLAQTDLVRQLQARTVKREYLALVIGDVARAGSVDAPIGRHPTRRTTMAVVSAGKPARTHYAVSERFGAVTLLKCRLETGRTHQIRVHLASIGHPLVGDRAYGRRQPIAFSRQALHAHRLGLLHPVTRDPCQWEAPLPPDMLALIDSLRATKNARK